MHEALHLITVAGSYIANHRNEILALFGGTAGLWVVVQTVLVKLKINGPRLSFLLSHLAAMLTALANYGLSSGKPNIGITYALVWIVLEGWHHLILNPNYNKYFVPFLNWLNQVKAPADSKPDATETSTETFT